MYRTAADTNEAPTISTNSRLPILIVPPAGLARVLIRRSILRECAYRLRSLPMAGEAMLSPDAFLGGSLELERSGANTP